MVDLIIEAKRGFSVSIGDGDMEMPDGVSILQAVNNLELASISPEYSQELAQSIINYHQRIFGDKAERYKTSNHNLDFAMMRKGFNLLQINVDKVDFF